MSLDDVRPSSPASPQEAPAAAGASPGRPSAALTWIAAALAVAGLASSVLLWQKVNGMQELLARQTADSSTQAVEARALARESQDLVRETSARLSVLEARVNEVTLQRGQLETLMQSIARSRDENLVVDIESTLRMALQQAQLSGRIEPLVTTLKTAQQRVERAAQPRLAPVQRALANDLERLSRLAVTDTAGLLARLDDLVQLVDELPLRNGAPLPQPSRPVAAAPAPTPDTTASPSEWAWWSAHADRIAAAVAQEARSLLRVSRIDHPDAVLLAPEQAYFLKENLKLKLLNARLGLLARQVDAARADLGQASQALATYFDANSRRTQNAQLLLQQVQTHMRSSEQPTLNDSLAALATAAAAR